MHQAGAAAWATCCNGLCARPRPGPVRSRETQRDPVRRRASTAQLRRCALLLSFRSRWQATAGEPPIPHRAWPLAASYRAGGERGGLVGGAAVGWDDEPGELVEEPGEPEEVGEERGCGFHDPVGVVLVGFVVLRPAPGERGRRLCGRALPGSPRRRRRMRERRRWGWDRAQKHPQPRSRIEPRDRPQIASNRSSQRRQNASCSTSGFTFPVGSRFLLHHGSLPVPGPAASPQGIRSPGRLMRERAVGDR